MELTGINRKSLSGYENNVAEPDLNTFATLARLYDLSADDVLEIKPGHASLSLSRLEPGCCWYFIHCQKKGSENSLSN